MKKLAQATAFLLGLTLPVLAQASQLLPMTASCKTVADNKSMLEGEYQEIPMAGGASVIRLTNGDIVGGIGKVYVNPQTKAFTVVIEFPEADRACALLMGDDFAPLEREPNV